MCESRKYRKIHAKPVCSCFGPKGKVSRGSGGIRLQLDEFEALRLADSRGMYQEDAAKKMGVSRQTFGNIINSARQKVADALVCGKSIQITGGTVKLAAGGCGCGKHDGQGRRRCCESEKKTTRPVGNKKPAKRTKPGK
ncbi:MAG: hypothetical protein UY62_C0063G0006 [Parcubacteria group bacterium GW2011_GWF2_50_9]|nr:MAG: hypothetical protein UY62_C0063G0006 [Parcubacteria group bacterium GW2011_GWF2_50_9]